MDFLEIRRKAKERAAARAAAAPSLALEPLPLPSGAPPRPPEPPPAAPAATTAPPAPPPPPATPPMVEPWLDRPGSWSPAPEELPAPRLEPDPAPAWSAGIPEPEIAASVVLSPAEADALEAAQEALQRAAAAQAEEQARAEAELEGKLRDLQVAPDARFSTYRPSGPAPARAERAVRGAAAVPEEPLVAELESAEPPELRWDPLAEPREEPDPPREVRAVALAARRPPAPPADPLDDFFYRADESGPDLGELALPAPLPAQAPEVDQKVEYLTFLLGAEVYGVEIDRVREVMRAPPITEVPRAPADVLGVITVRGEVVAVFDPRARLGLPAMGPSGGGRVVIVDDGGGPCGLQVDAVSSVVRLLRGQVEACPSGLGGASADCLEGIGRDRDRLFTILSVAALLRPGRRQPEGRG